MASDPPPPRKCLFVRICVKYRYKLKLAEAKCSALFFYIKDIEFSIFKKKLNKIDLIKLRLSLNRTRKIWLRTTNQPDLNVVQIVSRHVMLDLWRLKRFGGGKWFWFQNNRMQIKTFLFKIIVGHKILVEKFCVLFWFGYEGLRRG